MNIWRHLRKNLFHLTQSEFASVVGSTQATVSRWERGELHPTYVELVKIRQYAKENRFVWHDALFFEPAGVDEAA